VTRQAPRLRIGLSLGNIGALHDGLGEFALQIGTRVAAQAPAWRDAYGIGIDFHLKDRFFGLFGAEVGYLGVNRWQRLHHVQPQPYALWHTLHQLSKNLPPVHRRAPKPVRLVTVHDLNYLVGRNAWSTWRHHRRTQALMARTDALAAISRYTADEVRRHLHWARPIEVIHNGARSFVGAPQAPLPGWTSPCDRPFLFHLSRMSPSKNPQAIIELARAWPEMTFLMCGPPSDDAKQLRASVRLPNMEFHLGISDAQKAWAYGQCAGFVFPSLTEGFGLPPIEAMHFGKPTFLARRSCLPEIGGDAAEYFDDFQPAVMRSVVEQGLLRHAREHRAAVVQAHAAQFNWDVCAGHYLDLYRRLLGLPPG
jgi:glycosyltransferase involved in cell wall biosynthesis